VYLQNWTHVMNFVSKAESTPDVMDQGKVLFVILLVEFL